jgi:hypothetical protein
MDQQRRFWERRAVRGLLLTLDDQRGALILQTDADRVGCECWLKQPQAMFGFLAPVRHHVLHGRPVCAAVFTSLPAGLYLVQHPVWAAGARFSVAVGRVTLGDLRTAAAPTPVPRDAQR